MRIAAILAALLLGAAVLTVPQAAQATDLRTCNTNERPRQIRLITQGGWVYCYGGYVGPLGLGAGLNIDTLVAGDYTGVLWCKEGVGWFGQAFEPGEYWPVRRTCQQLNITPPN